MYYNIHNIYKYTHVLYEHMYMYNMYIDITKEHLKTFLRCSHHGTPKFKM